MGHEGLDIFGTMDNLSAVASVLQATLPILKKTAAASLLDKSGESAANVSALNASDVRMDETICHACALDSSNGLWTMATTWENGRPVLMALKGTLSSPVHYLERMCIYRMPYPDCLMHPASQLDGKAGLTSVVHLIPLMQDNLNAQERLERIQAADAALEEWYHAPTTEGAHKIFCKDVQILKETVDPETRERQADIFTFSKLLTQARAGFSKMRKLHILGSLLGTNHFVSFQQGYEVEVDHNNVTWRSSSIRLRFYDPSQDYKLRVGIIFRSDRNLTKGRVIPAPSAGDASSRPEVPDLAITLPSKRSCTALCG